MQRSPVINHRRVPTVVCRVCFLGLVAIFSLQAVRAQSIAPQSDQENNGHEIEVTSLFEPREYSDSDGNTLQYRLLKPKNFDPDEKYPLVLFLHGAGERGDDNVSQLVHGMADFVKRQEAYPCYVLAPQCPREKKWVEVPWDRDKVEQPESPSISMKLAIDLIGTMVENGHVDKARLYITGLSMGGYGTWDAITRYPDMFAAAAPLCGGGDVESMTQCKSIPIWCFHGDQDRAVPVSQSRVLVAKLEEMGGDIKYTEYAGVGHDCWTDTYSNDAFFEWLFKQRR